MLSKCAAIATIAAAASALDVEQYGRTRWAAPQPRPYYKEVRSTAQPLAKKAQSGPHNPRWASEPEPTETIKATCKFDFVDGSKGKGTISLTQAPGDLTAIEADFTGLKGGQHAFGVHEFGDLSNGCYAAGPRFNPYRAPHGHSDDDIDERMMGDIEQIQALRDGRSLYKNRDHYVTLSGPDSVIGRSMVIYEGRDDFDINENDGSEGREKRERKGPGKRIACCVIALDEGDAKKH